MNLHFLKIPILFFTAFALAGCSGQSSLEADRKAEYRDSRPLLEWIRSAEFVSSGQVLRIPVRNIGEATAKQRKLLEAHDDSVDVKFSPERRLQSVQVAGSSPSLEFAVLHAFANYISWLESQVEELSDSTLNQTSQSKIANFSFKVVKESKPEFSKTTISLIGPNGKSAEYSESVQVKIDGAMDGNPDVKWSFSHSGGLEFKTFISDVLGVTESRGPEYALEIFENPQNHLYHALMKIHFP
jgi:hypothetical protein